MADRVITAPEDRRTAVLQVIREARRTILLSLFRCTDEGIFEELAAATARGVILGTTAYMSPEQASGRWPSFRSRGHSNAARLKPDSTYRIFG